VRLLRTDQQESKIKIRHRDQHQHVPTELNDSILSSAATLTALSFCPYSDASPVIFDISAKKGFRTFFDPRKRRRNVSVPVHLLVRWMRFPSKGDLIDIQFIVHSSAD
jgi:hypothetical protein